MTIPRDIPIHGTGHTVGDILDAAAQAGGGGGGGSYTLPVATSTVLGGVKDGARVTIAGDGTISADVQAGTYTLPVATDTVLGGVKQGSGVTIDGAGVISASGGSPQPGQPTRFLTLTYTHPGNEDGSSASATTGIPIPNSTIAEGDAWMVNIQARGVTSDPHDIYIYQTGDFYTTLYRVADGSASFSGSPNYDENFKNHTGAMDSDPQVFFQLSTSGNALFAHIWGMSTNTPTDWTINVQLTPIAP